MSWGPGSLLGWAGFLVGRGLTWGCCWWGKMPGRAEKDQTSLPETEEVGRGMYARRKP